MTVGSVAILLVVASNVWNKLKHQRGYSWEKTKKKVVAKRR
ncbi:MAG: hypothetical protein Q7S25_05165 [Candidatus Limnocylindria bacterium]|nr:hypothetical protein [Candidatus Limnocylindria bacterium]